MPFRDDLAANFAELSISKVAMITGNVWIDRNAEAISHHARALVCEIGLCDLADSFVDTQVTSSIGKARTCNAQA